MRLDGKMMILARATQEENLRRDRFDLGKHMQTRWRKVVLKPPTSRPCGGVHFV
jgi:hypothetical protein